MDGDCVLLLSHKGTATREPEPFNGAFRDTQDYFLLPFPQHSSEIYLYHLNCRLFPSSVRFWAELIRALTCTR